MKDSFNLKRALTNTIIILLMLGLGIVGAISVMGLGLSIGWGLAGFLGVP